MVSISISNLSIIKTGKAKAIKLSTLDAIDDVKRQQATGFSCRNTNSSPEPKLNEVKLTIRK
ncbi:MAG: hypothetical protein NTY95_08770 [Bacteroidia bacterium]|nr:hypothetical protein [Bacteroidia bacterium]